MKKLLLTGASGFLGWNLCQYPQEDWEIIGLYHQHRSGVPKQIAAHQVDLSDQEAFKKIVNQVKPDAIVHLAAISNTRYCQEHPELTGRLNILVPGQIAHACQQLSIPFIHASSGQVYDGKLPPYRESAELQPLNTYGLQKVAAEALVRETYPEACIFRPTVMFGHHSTSSYCFMTDWLQRWDQGETVTAFHDEIRCFLSGRSAAEGILLLLEKEAKGIFNLAGKEAISRLEFAQLLAKTFSVKEARIKSAAQQDIPGLAEVRPSDLTMNLDKVTQLGFKARGVAEELRALL